jgi:CheY-like chemotaxis protein
VTSFLVVDDEPDQRERLARALTGAAREIRLAGSAREAIDAGCRLRPDALVVDWLLCDHLNGMQVAEAVAAVVPEVAVVVATRFAGPDLRAAAARAQAELVEKPCAPQALRAALAAARARLPRPALAALEADAAGRVLHRSAAAARLLDACAPEPRAERVGDALGLRGDPLLPAARRWLRAAPRAGAPGLWARTHEPRLGRSQLWLLRREDEHLAPALVERVLGVEERALPCWPDGRVLVLDDDELHRHVGVALLESAGAVALSAASDAEALRLLTHDRGIAFLVVDHELPGSDLASFLRRARALRPDLRVVGNSAFERGAEFAALDVTRFLRKPWRAAELLAALRGMSP